MPEVIDCTAGAHAPARFARFPPVLPPKLDIFEETNKITWSDFKTLKKKKLNVAVRGKHVATAQRKQQNS